MGLFTVKNRKQYSKKVGRKKKGYYPRLRTEKKKQKRNVTKVIMIDDEELMSKQQLQKKLKNRNSSITISGKRRTKMLKRLRHSAVQDKVKVAEDVDMTEESTKKRKKKQTKTKDVEMVDAS